MYTHAAYKCLSDLQSRSTVYGNKVTLILLLCLQVARMIILVALTFMICWTPFYMVSFVSQVQESSFLKRSNFIFTMLLIHLIGFINSCLNPFIYSAMSQKYRNHFRLILLNIFCRLTTLRRWHSAPVNTSEEQIRLYERPANLSEQIENRSPPFNSTQTTLAARRARSVGDVQRLPHNETFSILEGQPLNDTIVKENGQESLDDGILINFPKHQSA